MLVDNNHIFQPSYFTSASSSSSSSSNTTFPDYSTELSDIFDTELFNSTFAIGSSSAQSSTSRGSSPQSLMTPPQDPLPTSFPDVHEDESGAGASSTTSSFYSLFDDDLKTMDPLSSMPMSLPSASADFMDGVGAMDTSYGGGLPSFDMPLSMGGFGGMGMGMGMDLSSLGMGLMDQDPMQGRGIDPQLVDTPSAVSDHGEDDSDEKESPQSPPQAAAQQPPPVVVEPPTQEVAKPTITIAPVKVGGHGKARKGTVQSGGVVKKTSSNANKEKENVLSSYSSALSSSKKNSSSINNTLAKSSTSTTTSPSAYKASTPGPFLSAGNSAASSKADSEAGGDDEDDDKDDLPQDWRPSPEVFAKMTSKEKRQLRNKISARNFRVRRKEYIATLEGDIAERDRMLDHFRTQLGSRESENLALRQEVAALKKALLEGRGGPISINLPPPAPLPETSAAEALLSSLSSSSSATTSTTTTAAAAATSSPLLTPNTQKDLPSSSPSLSANAAANRFWGGAAGMGMGGYTPVHTALVPDVGSVLRRGLLQENMNPALNSNSAAVNNNGVGERERDRRAAGLGGFDGFADLNPFTMKTLEAYRMHLWGKMAQQQQQHHHHATNNTNNNSYSPTSSASSSPSPPTSHSHLAEKMRPHFFTPSSKPNLPSAGYGNGYGYGSGYGSTLSALLSGKHASSTYSSPYSATNGSAAYPSPPPSPLLNPKGAPSSALVLQQRREKEQQQQQHAMLAAMASQTILGKLGAAFWDAFTGHSGSSSSSSSLSSSVGSSSSSLSSSSRADWDTDKVQRVLSGKAVLRVVDVDPPSPASSPSLPAAAAAVVKKEEHPQSRVQDEEGFKRGAGACAGVCGSAGGCITDILEESMRSLTLGKK